MTIGLQQCQCQRRRRRRRRRWIELGLRMDRGRIFVWVHVRMCQMTDNDNRHNHLDGHCWAPRLIESTEMDGDEVKLDVLDRYANPPPLNEWMKTKRKIGKYFSENEYSQQRGMGSLWNVYAILSNSHRPLSITLKNLIIWTLSTVTCKVSYFSPTDL